METEKFEELFNKSINEKKFDKIVTGTVIGISSKGEIFVDFGYKADGIIPLKEYSDNDENPKNEFKEGDTISADILKWNDGLGNVLLSYKRLKNREKLLIEKELRIKQAEEREKNRQEKVRKIENFWNDIKVGKTYTGIISKIEDYGLIVDLGIRKGLLHKSEIIWNKNEKLDQRFSLNDKIEVVVKNFNKEENKINLEYPLKGENPWLEKVKKYNINDIVTCKVIRFMQFGAFLEIEKGLEGLVHNSQITALKRVIKPDEVLKLGQIINAKIISIDKENLRIGLSIKELEGTSSEYGYESYIKGDKE